MKHHERDRNIHSKIKLEIYQTWDSVVIHFEFHHPLINHPSRRPQAMAVLPKAVIHPGKIRISQFPGNRDRQVQPGPNKPYALSQRPAIDSTCDTS